MLILLYFVIFKTPQSGANYMMRSNDDVKLQQNGPWNQYGAEPRTQQGNPRSI